MKPKMDIGKFTNDKGVIKMNWLKKNYRFLIILFFFISIVGLTFYNHKQEEQIKKMESTTEYVQQETDKFEPYENGGKLDNKLTDSDGNDVEPAPQY